MKILATLSIVSHGHSELLKGLLDDLSRQERIDQCLILVTLNLATEMLNIDAHLRLNIRVIRNVAEKGFGANHNSAFKYAEGTWFLVVNPDVRMPDPHTVEHLIRAGENAALRAPLVVNANGKIEDSIRVNLTPLAIIRRALGHDRRPVAFRGSTRKGQPFFWFAGMFMAIRCEAFSKIGGFNQRFYLYCEDYDLCARLYLAGYTLEIEDQIPIIHNARRSSHRASQFLRWHVASLLRVWSSGTFWRLSLSQWMSY